MKKIALITGANRGIGLETARQLGQKGITVLLGSRDAEKGEKAVLELKNEDLDVHLLLISPSERSSTYNAATEVREKFGLLDILVNNAGVLIEGDGPDILNVSSDLLLETYKTNVFGLHEVTRAFWPLLNKSKAARVVNVSSALGSLTLHSDGTFDGIKFIAYDSSKAAVNMLTNHYAHLWYNTPHRVNTIHPGSVKTDMNKNGELSLEDGAKTSVELALIPDNGPNGEFFHLGQKLPW